MKMDQLYKCPDTMYFRVTSQNKRVIIQLLLLLQGDKVMTTSIYLYTCYTKTVG